MARLRTEFEFKLDAEFWFSRDCMGKVLRFERDGFDVELCMPPFDNSRAAEIEPEDITYFDGFAGSERQQGDPDKFFLGVRNFRVCVYESVTDADKTSAEQRKSETLNLVADHQLRCWCVARDIAIAFLDQLRYRDQTWLGSMGTLPCSDAASPMTYEDDTGYRFKVVSRGNIHLEMGRGRHAADSTALEKIGHALTTAEGVPLPASLLADADHFLKFGLRNETQSDLQRAVLLAAIACELRLKEVLRSNTFPGAAALVDLLIAHPRDFSLSAAGLFDKGMKAAVGRSLRDDDKELYNAIADKEGSLFRNRNAIAHRGELVDPDKARNNVRAARDVFAWFDRLPILDSPPKV